MKKQYYVIIFLFLLVLGIAFWWYELRPYFILKNCFVKANTARENALIAENNAIMSGLEVTVITDYDKIFEKEYQRCLMESGISE